jgi:hypothetical protein
MYQLHEGIPPHSGAFVMNAVNFESSAATMAPLQSPSHAVKQPIATFLVVETRVSARPASGLSDFDLRSSIAVI